APRRGDGRARRRRRQHGRSLARRALDAVHGEPRVQARAAPTRGGEGHALHRRP
ncbi:MAG: Omega-amino acid--pyruvate aminotransferase, partial [uncultured Gemmatimonadaceae bacterium]